MNCFKLTVDEDRFCSSSSRKAIKKLTREVCKELHQTPNGETCMMFLETDVFPKEYYFNTLDKRLFKKIAAKWKVEQITCADSSKLLTGNIQYLRNKHLILTQHLN
jgi:hypothetical protein